MGMVEFRNALSGRVNMIDIHCDWDLDVIWCINPTGRQPVKDIIRGHYDLLLVGVRPVPHEMLNEGQQLNPGGAAQTVGECIPVTGTKVHNCLIVYILDFWREFLICVNLICNFDQVDASV